LESGHQVYDPHVWFDVALWSQGIAYLADSYSEAFPDLADILHQNAEAYVEELERLDQKLRQAYATVPSGNRILVTSHDAFSYFGMAYGFEVRGLQGVSTVSEVSLRDLADLVDTMVQRQIPAVFVESSVSPRTIQSLVEGCRQKGWEIAIGGELFSDAMGDAGTPEGRYTGMLEHNARLIVEALGGSWPAVSKPAASTSDADQHAVPKTAS
jgi:manganese/zinc/iron transport system substrate-binding protein